MSPETLDHEIPPAGKRHGRWRRWVVRPVFWAVALVLVALGLGLLYLLSDAMAERARVFTEARLSEALGRPVSLAALELEVLPPAFEARDLVLPGPTDADPPLAVLPRVRVELSFRGFTRPVLTVHRLWLERPRFFLQVTEDGKRLRR